MFQFPLQLNFVKITCCPAKFVPVHQQFPKKWLPDLHFLTSSSGTTSKGAVEARCTCSDPNSTYTFAGSTVCLRPRAASRRASHVSDSPGRRRRAEESAALGKTAFAERRTRNLVSGIQHKFGRPPRMFQFSLNVHNDSEFCRLCSTLLNKANVNLWILTSPFWIRTILNQA